MKNASRADGREHDEHAKAEPLFPSDGRFKAVVPLSQLDDEAAPTREALASDEPEEETTLVPARRSRARLPHTPRAKRGIEQSWPFLAAVLTLSVVSGLAAGAYMIRSLRPSETHSAGTPAAGVAAESVEKSAGTKPAAAPPAPPASAPAPQTEQNRLAALPVAGEASDEPDVKVESINGAARPRKSSTDEDELAADRAEVTKPRTRTRARAAEDAEPAPKLTRADAGPRRPERPARAAASPERNLPISSPPPSAKSRKVIQWP